ncbi:HNH endonuclease signature motif containing protein [Humibacter albus]|uniref:HNH endonuclease signature motif containing protein n=1 Tax=Humibacter albus TaxID=427754 RepID=UPI0003B696F0|nr:HNH endonuclease signature motif containing protein [Humibacter albus]
MDFEEIAIAELTGLASRFAALERDLARLQARRVALLGEADTWAERHANAVIGLTEPPASRRELAHRMAVAELATATHISERTIAGHVATAVGILSRHDTFAALADGSISMGHASLIAEEVTGLVGVDGEPADESVAAEFEHAILEVATEKSTGLTRRAARRLRERFAPESLTTRHERACEQRRVWVEPADDGMSWIHALIPTDAAALFWHDITSIAVDRRDTTRVPGQPESVMDERDLDQLRADILADQLGFLSALQCEGAFIDGTRDGGTPIGSAPTRVIPSLQVLVTVPVMTLTGVSDEPGELDGYGPVPPEMARRLVAHAPSMTRVLTHPVTGTVLDVDRTTYKVPAALRRWLALRDGTCRFPGCGRRSLACDLDHTIAWEDGGTTSADNLSHLCRKHHRLKHVVGWTVEQTSGVAGELRWTSPTGAVRTSAPAVRMGAVARVPTTPEATAAEATDVEAAGTEPAVLQPVAPGSVR